jgi:hypothetical protein
LGGHFGGKYPHFAVSRQASGYRALMELFTGTVRVMVMMAFVLLPPLIFIFFSVGCAYQKGSKRGLRKILIRAVLLGVGIGLPICMVLAALMTCWLITHMAPPN